MTISAGRQEQKLLDLRAKVFRGLSDSSRLAILLALLPGRRSVNEIVEDTGLNQPNTSAHLSCLHDCGLVSREPEGRFVYYRLAGAEVQELLEAADALLRRDADKIAACINYQADRRTPNRMTVSRTNSAHHTRGGTR